MEDNTITQNLKTIQNRIDQACKKSDRNPQDVRLLLATKTVSIEKIQQAVHQGYSLLGENKVQEAMPKYEALGDKKNLNWHMIGHLQTNKVKFVTQFADVVQSIDRLKLARKLHNRLKYDGRAGIAVFIQINTSYETSKFGVSPENAIEFIKKVSEFPRLHIKGLMTIGILSSQDEKVRDCFKLLKEIQSKARELQLPQASFDQLSMGMSNDFEMAIEEGSTIVRVGSAIFGERPYPDSYYWNER